MDERDNRPDPDALLAAIQKQDAEQARGKLKIFLGMSAGVGKTYAMLEAAHQFRQSGGDVVIGYVETHKRPETNALLDGLETIPPLQIEYRGAMLREVDIDAIIARKPQLVLVDELAHTNAQGCRHAKRYQDVLDLLEAGIDVWTTVNVQHFESRADAVRQITGITIYETIPDSLLDFANEIELIDLSPADLRKRLSEGKVYTSERIETAMNNFFRVGNLTALREMSLRLTAEHVDHKLQDYMQIKRIAGPWKSGERLMVAVGPSPFSERLIRWTRRVAYNLEAEWLAVYVETTNPPTLEAKKRLARNITLARSLGAEIVVGRGDSIPQTLLKIAQQRNVSQIVIGKPQHSPLRAILRGGSLVDKIIRLSGDIDVLVVKGDDETENQTHAPIRFDTEFRSKRRHYLMALAVFFLIIGVDLLAYSFFLLNYQALALIDLFAVLLVATYLGRGPGILIATLSALSWNFFFINPRFTFTISQPQDILMFILYFAIAIFTGNLTARIRQQEKQAHYTAERTNALYILAHETANAVNMNDVLKTALDQISRVFDADVAILLMINDTLQPPSDLEGTMPITEKEYAVAHWVYTHKKPAGRFTDTLSLASAQYLPLLTPTRIVGVIGIRTRQDERLSLDQEGLLETFISQIALVIERELLDESAEQSAMLRESERLYTTLLNSISHELRTPIATIKGASTSLLHHPTHDNIQNRIQLIQDIEDSADRLNRLVENLLDMSRLESGRLSLKREWCDITDIIGVAMKQLSECQSRPIILDLPADLPLIYVDFGLMVQIFINLMDNACRYTPADKPIRITTHQHDKHLYVSVIDKGAGIPPELLERIFDKFYRLPGTVTGGTGLGLSISRGLAEAHKATLTADNMPDGGAKFTLSLSLQEVPPPVREVKDE